MEELKASLSSSHDAPEGHEQDAQERRAVLESLKMEHQLETENLKAKHKIEAAILTKEREDLCTRLQEAKDQLAEGSLTWRAEAEAKSGKRALEEATDKLVKAEQRLAETEALQTEQGRSTEELRGRLELSEKKMTDYQALQKAQAESQEEIQKLEENLRVTANQLQAIQADRYTSRDANVSQWGQKSNLLSLCLNSSSTLLIFLFQVIEDNDISDEKMKLKQNIEGIKVLYVYKLLKYLCVGVAVRCISLNS